MTKKRSRGALLLILSIAIVGALGLGFAAWSFTGSANAFPGNTCAPPTPDHGGPECHVGGSSTTVQPGTSTTAQGSATTETTSPSAPANEGSILDQNNCLSCHGDPSLAKQQPDGTSVSLYVDSTGSVNSAHRYTDCTTCHGTEPHNTDNPFNTLSLGEKCGTCHQYQYDQYKDSVHGASQSSGNSDPATCTDCHSVTSDPHNIVRVLDPSASTYPKNIADTCAKCHNDSDLMDRYGIVEKVYSSYMRSFHGKAIDLEPDNAAIGQLDTATCVSCHGAHNIASVSDPTAPVSGMENLLTTCQDCHEDAGPEFVEGFVGHKAVNTEFLPEVYWGGRAFYIFTVAMLAGGALITLTSIALRVVPWVGRRVKRGKNKEG